MRRTNNNLGFDDNDIALTANTDDLQKTSHMTDISSDAAYDVTGINAKGYNAIIELVNTGAFNITLKHDDPASAVGNQIFNQNNLDLVLQPYQNVRYVYKSYVGRTGWWQLT